MDNKTPSPPDFSHTFEEFLCHQFETRRQANQRLSLRAFARLLRTDVSQLSKLIRGKRPASDLTIQKFGKLLGLSKYDIEEYQLLSKLKKKYPRLANSKLKYPALPTEQFEYISDYRHSLILEMTKIPNLKLSVPFLSKIFDCHVSEIETIINRLKKIGALDIQKNGKWTSTQDSVSFWPDQNLTSLAHRRYQDHILQLAHKALHSTPIHKRDQSSITAVTSKEKIQEAKARIKEFRRDLCAFLEESETKDSVYQISLSLFPVFETTDL